MGATVNPAEPDAYRCVRCDGPTNDLALICAGCFDDMQRNGLTDADRKRLGVRP